MSKNLNLTPRAQNLIKDATAYALKFGHSDIGFSHVFLGFLNLAETAGNQIFDAFQKFKIDPKVLKAEITIYLENKKPSQKSTKVNPILDKDCRDLLKASKALSNKYDHKYVGVEHIFISLFEIASEDFSEFLNKIEDCPLERAVDFIEKTINEDIFADQEETSSQGSQQESVKKYLNSYSVCLNTQVATGKINNLHVNDKLIQKISEVLCRKNKNNPLIVGEAGVGKTALVESLAQSIVQGQCSDFLALKQIYSLDVPMIVAGCKYRGEFEEKIKNILKEATEDPNVILFIDEIHTIIGAGNPENGMDVANILKPYLARGEISCVGATTFDEYRKTIADDPALSRRFQIIKLEEPSKEETFHLVKGIKCSYEEFHCVEYPDDILRYIIDIADKYLSGRFPDKVLDLIDQTGSNVKLSLFKKDSKMLKIQKKIQEIAEKHSQKPEDKNLATVEKLLRQYQEATLKMVSKWETKKYQIQEKDILSVVANKTNIPIEELNRKDFDKLKCVRKALDENIIGQSEQIDQIYKSLLRSKAGFRDEKKPISSLLFAGPTGVGKTFAAKMIAENLFSNRSSLVHLDMSEYADKTAINKLLGSSPGYIGYEKGGALTEKIKKNPYSIILFDEIQKADSDVLSCLLQILEEGRLTDSYGSVVDFTNCIIVFTTNVGSEGLTISHMGFGNQSSFIQNDVLIAVKKVFPPDLLNRIDEIVVFNNLNEQDVKKIIVKEINKVCADMKTKGVSIKHGIELIDWIYSKIQLQNFGARQVQKTIQREFQTVLAEKFLEDGSIKEIDISVTNGKLMCN